MFNPVPGPSDVPFRQVPVSKIKKANAGAMQQRQIEQLRLDRDNIWIYFEAMITEKTLKEESTNKN